MATTYTASVSLKASGLANLAAETITASGTASGDSDILYETQDIGTSSEAITTGEIAAGGCKYLQITNLDAVHFVSFSFENPAVAGTKAFKLEAGGTCMFPTPSGTLYAIADTAVVKISKKAVEN